MSFAWITFVFPYAFLLFLGLILLGVYFLSNKQKKWVHISSFDDVLRVYKKHSLYYYLVYTLFFLGGSIFIILFANPKQFFVEETVKKNGIDIVLVLDLSYSMQATDISPSRLEAAKKVSSDFIQKLQTDRVWLVLFAGVPFISVPMTFDYRFIQSFLTEIHRDTIEQSSTTLWGTAVGDALLLAVKALDIENSQEREKVIIFITDGAATTWVDPLLVLKYLKEKRIKTYTIWVWWDTDTFVILENPFGFPEKRLIWPVDEESLQKIAWETWGQYFRVTNEDTFERVFDEIQKLEKKEIVVESQTIEKERYFLLSLILCCIYIGIFWLLGFKSIRV